MTDDERMERLAQQVTALIKSGSFTEPGLEFQKQIFRAMSSAAAGALARIKKERAEQENQP